MYAENIRQRPAQASVWLLRPLTPRISFRLGYDMDYTRFARGDSTAPGFIVPANQVVHGARVALDAQRSGWNASVWWNPAYAGPAGARGERPGSAEYRTGQRDFQRYGASLARSAVISPRLVARSRARGWRAAISIASAGTRSARSTTGFTAIRRR